MSNVRNVSLNKGMVIYLSELHIDFIGAIAKQIIKTYAMSDCPTNHA